MALTKEQKSIANKKYYEANKERWRAGYNKPTTPPASVTNTPSAPPPASSYVGSPTKDCMLDLIKLLQEERDEYRSQVHKFKAMLLPLVTELNKRGNPVT